MLLRLIFSCLLFILCAPSRGGQIQIYTENVAPYSYLKDGKLVGFSVDLVLELQRRLGLQQKIRVVPWLRAMRYLENKTPTMVFTMARTAEREHLCQWVGPVGQLRLNFLVAAEDKRDLSQLESVRQLRGVGVVDGAIEQALLNKHQFRNLVPVNNYATGFRMVANKRVDVWAGNEWVLLYKLHSLSGKVDQFRLLKTNMKAPLYLAFSHSTPAVEVARWQKALEQMKQDGRFEQIVKRNKQYFSHIHRPGD